MALNISIENDSGVPAVYWNIGAIQQDFKNAADMADITVYGYISEDARRANKQPLSAKQYRMPVQDGVSIDVVRAAAYGYLKQQPDFADATDC